MPDWFVQLVTVCGAPAAVYAGIRYDLGKLQEKAENAARSASKAHARLDEIMMGARRAG